MVVGSGRLRIIFFFVIVDSKFIKLFVFEFSYVIFFKFCNINSFFRVLFIFKIILFVSSYILVSIVVDNLLKFSSSFLSK